MKLTKKFRVVYDSGGIIQNDPYEEHDSKSITLVPDRLKGYEAQLKTTIENFIQENNLTIKEEIENGS